MSSDIFVSLAIVLLLALVIIIIIDHWRWLSSTPNPVPSVPFSDPKSAINIPSREELFNIFLPRAYASWRPRRHGYVLGFELTTLLVHKLDIPIPELLSFSNDRTKLKAALKRIWDISMCNHYEHAIEGWRLLADYDNMNRTYNISQRDRDLRERLEERITQVDANLFFPSPNRPLETKLPDCTWTYVVEKVVVLGMMGICFDRHKLYKCWYDDEACKSLMQNAQDLYTDWFREYWHHGKDHAREFVKSKTWKPEHFEMEKRIRAGKVENCKIVVTAIQNMANPPPVLTIPATFHPFPRLPSELRVRIWKMSWEPRIVEIQGSIQHKFDNLPDKYGMLPRSRYGVPLPADYAGSYEEYNVIEDEEGDEWVYRESGNARNRRDHRKMSDESKDFGTADREMAEEDKLEDYRWSYEPAFKCLARTLNRLDVTKLETEELLKVKDVGRSGDRAMWKMPPEPVTPEKQVVRIAGILSKMEDSKHYDKYKWPQMPGALLFKTIFKKIDNGKNDDEILRELKEPSESPEPISFWVRQRKALALADELRQAEQEELRNAESQRQAEQDELSDAESQSEASSGWHPTYKYQDETFPFSSPTVPPASLFVCRESREETKKYYELGFNDRSTNFPGIWIKYDIDTVLCVYETFGNRRHAFEQVGNHRHVLDWERRSGGGGWSAGFEHWSHETLKKIRRIAISAELWTTFVTKSMRDICPALDDVAIILNNVSDSEDRDVQTGWWEDELLHEEPSTSEVEDRLRDLNLKYQLVGYHKTHLAFNERFPDHDNDFFRNPFRRYLDAPHWVPGLDGPEGYGEECRDRMEYLPNVPGVFPIGSDFVKQLQRLPVTLTTQEFTGPGPGERDWDENTKDGQEHVTLRFVVLRRGGFNFTNHIRPPPTNRRGADSVLDS